MILPSLLVISLGMGAVDLPVRASNEGLLRPRVARAQKIIRLHPLPFFSSLLCRETGSLPIDHPHSRQDQRNAEDFAHTH